MQAAEQQYRQEIARTPTGGVIFLERGDLNYPEMALLYRQHYDEMRSRLEKYGTPTSPFKPRLDQYFPAWRDGWLLCFVLRENGKPVGYSNIYLTNDMHNGDFIAQEDAIYVLPEHRNGAGRHLAKAVLSELERRGVKRLLISAVTDLRAAVLWRRMGFKNLAQQMVYQFKG